MSTVIFIFQILLQAVPIVFAVTLHEVSHGWVAKMNGDSTAYDLGRLTLNPMKHIDILGTLLLPLILVLLIGMPFGWAKPVPVNWTRLKKPRRDVALVALAGPAANLFMLLFWALVLSIAVNTTADYWSIAQFIIQIANIGILINIMMIVLNLLPIPPLDGSRVISALLPATWANAYNRIEPYGIVAVLVVMIFLFYTGLLFSFSSQLGESFRALVLQTVSFISL